MRLAPAAAVLLTLPLVVFVASDGLYVRLKTALAGRGGDAVGLAVAAVVVGLFVAGLVLGWRSREPVDQRPRRVQTVASVLLVAGLLPVFGAIDPWLDGRRYVPVAALYVLSALALSARRAAAPSVAMGFAVLPALFATGLVAAVGAGWEPMDVGLALVDRPLYGVAAYPFLTVLMWALAAWTVSVLRRAEVRAYYEGGDVGAAPPAVTS